MTMFALSSLFKKVILLSREVNKNKIFDVRNYIEAKLRNYSGLNCLEFFAFMAVAVQTYSVRRNILSVNMPEMKVKSSLIGFIFLYPFVYEKSYSEIFALFQALRTKSITKGLVEMLTISIKNNSFIVSSVKTNRC